MEILLKHSCRVWYAEILSWLNSPFQNLLLDNLTYQLLKLSWTKFDISLADLVGS